MSEDGSTRLARAYVAALQILDQCRQLRAWHTRSRFGVEDAGVEVEVIACYVQRMTLLGTVAWLRDNKGYQSSKSAIHRYWGKLRRFGILPVLPR